MNVNKVADALQDLINRVPPTQLAVALGAALGLVLIGIVLVAARRRWTGLVVGVIGLAGSLAALVVIDNQTVTIRESESVSVTRPRYREKTRTLARGMMLGLPGVVVLGGLGAWVSARRRLRKSVPGLLKAGRMHLFSKEFEPALAAFGRAIRISPFLADAYCGRAAAYHGLGDLDRALADFTQAIQYDPRMANAFIQRARIRIEIGDLSDALADLNRVMEIQPNDPELYLNRGICFFRQGLVPEAAADFQRVLKLTNHTDFAEPAKELLRQLEERAAGPPFSPALRAPESNGVAEPEALPEPRARDSTT